MFKFRILNHSTGEVIDCDKVQPLRSYVKHWVKYYSFNDIEIRSNDEQVNDYLKTIAIENCKVAVMCEGCGTHIFMDDTSDKDGWFCVNCLNVIEEDFDDDFGDDFDDICLDDYFLDDEDEDEERDLV